MNSFRHIDLFSGIGGFSLAAQWVWEDEHEIVCFCEKDQFCQKVLGKHWPNVPIIKEIHDIQKIKTCVEKDKAGISLLTGGFPCQSFSVAGKQCGKQDDRYLWPAMFKVIQQTKPRWVIGENVAGIIKLALDTVLSDLEAEGYTARAFIIPATSKNAPHKRERVWIVAHTVSNTKGSAYRRTIRKRGGRRNEQDKCQRNEMGGNTANGSEDVPNTGNQRSQRSKQQRALGKGTGSSQSTSERSKNVADTNGNGEKRNKSKNRQRGGVKQDGQDMADTSRGQRKQRIPKSKQVLRRSGAESKRVGGEYTADTKGQFESGLGFEDDGISGRLARHFPELWKTDAWEAGVPRVAVKIPDRVNKLKALGNSIVPQVVYEIMKAIKETDDMEGG
jgi:DNA (cytosine-5)-methyltransferase 1